MAEHLGPIRVEQTMRLAHVLRVRAADHIEKGSYDKSA